MDPKPAPTSIVRRVEAPLARITVDDLLARVRPEWQAKSLLERVRSLLPIDPSSACQRLLNAAIHDLRHKIVRAGLDIAIDVAKTHKLPPISRSEDIEENYTTTNIIDLAYRMSLLDRPAWRKLRRAYEIRRDLEHEDDEYEATPEDCIYVFATCIDNVLAVDPVEILRVDEVKELVESETQAAPSPAYVKDFERTPPARKIEIGKYLISIALDPKQPDLIRRNAVDALRTFGPLTPSAAKIELASRFNQPGMRAPYSLLELKVAAAAELTPYLKTARVEGYFDDLIRRLNEAGHRWKAYDKHGALLDELDDAGGLAACPPSRRAALATWLVRCYLGEPGGMTSYGHVRHVFHSDVAAPRIEEVVSGNKSLVRDHLLALQKDRTVAGLLADKHIARRFDHLLDLVED